MSNDIERGSQSDRPSAETGIEALRQDPAFRGPVEPSDDHNHSDASNAHLASIYDTQEDQFEAAIPFIEEGLEKGERCLYVADDNTTAEVVDAMRNYGIDVDAVRASGALSIYTKEDTYLRTGEFDTDAMVAFWEDALEQATVAEDFTGIRAAAEMTWALDSGTSSDLLAEYEAVLNSVYEGEEYTVLCQYNRDRFPSEVIRDVVRTHPHLVSGDLVAHNPFHTPAEEFFGPDDPANEVDRMLGTVWDRAEAKTELRERQQYLRDQYEIAADTDWAFDEKLQALFDLGCDRFDLELGGLARIDPETDLFEVEAISGDHDHLVPGARLELSETCCRVVTDSTDVAGITDPFEAGFKGTKAYEEFGVRAYLGTRIELDNALDRTLFFISSESRDEVFSDAERTFHDLLGQWVKYELTHQQQKEQLRRKNDRLESFATLVAHELRNPVAIGQIYSQQLPDEADADSVEHVEDAFDRIEDMIDILLVVTRGRDAITDETAVQLGNTAHAAWAKSETDAATLEVTVNRTLRMDETYLEHLFRNLFENAVEHGDADTVTVGELPDASASGDSEDEQSESSGGFYVADDGSGVPAEAREKVFDVGYTTAADHGGTGVGLAFVSALADVYDWECSVTQSDAGGARFEFENVTWA